MSHAFATPSASFRQPAVSQPRRASVNTRTPAPPTQRLHGSLAVYSTETLPALSPRPRSVQTPAGRPNAGPPPTKPSPNGPRARITEMIFCVSIQDRTEWATVIPLLQAGRTEPRWEKARLSSHDLAVRIATEHSDTTAGGSSDTIQFLLVAPGDVGQPEATKKLQRIAQRKSGLGGVVVFLLSRGDGGGHNMAAYKQMQLDLRDTDLSILPLTAVATLPAAVAAFCSQFTMPLRTDQDSPSSPLHILVRMYFGGPAPLSIEGAKTLVAATATAAGRTAAANRPGTTLQDVIRFCSDLRGRSPHRLAELLGSGDASRLANF